MDNNKKIEELQKERDEKITIASNKYLLSVENGEKKFLRVVTEELKKYNRGETEELQFLLEKEEAFNQRCAEYKQVYNELLRDFDLLRNTRPQIKVFKPTPKATRKLRGYAIEICTWVDAAEVVEELKAEMRKRSPTHPLPVDVKEWKISDCKAFYGLDISKYYDDIEKVSEIASLIVKYGLNALGVIKYFDFDLNMARQCLERQRNPWGGLQDFYKEIAIPF